jgi:tetratricopeptide (TPR) repeat protein
MRITWRDARALTAALTAGLCAAVGCSTTGKPAVDSGPMPNATPSLQLTAAQEQQAEAVAHFGAGMALEISSGASAGLPEYQKSLELDPHNVSLALHVAQIYLNRRNFTNALAVLESTTKVNPDQPEAWYGLGVAYRTADQMPKAIAAWRQALKIDPTYSNAMRFLLDAYVQEGTAADVASVVGSALKQMTKDPDYWVGLGDTLNAVLRQKPSLAATIDRATIAKCYQKALALAPDDLETQARVADSYADSGDYQLAAEAYAKLLKARPNNPVILDRLWRMYAQSDQKDKAIATLEAMLKRDPLRFEVYNALGDLYDDLDKPERAIANYQQSLVLNPNQLNLYVRVALDQMRLKKYADAGLTLTQAAEKFPTKYQIPYLVGLMESDQKNYTNAINSFAEAETLAKEDPEETKPSSAFYFAYGSACERFGDDEKAAAMFRKAIDLDPNNHNAYNYLGYMWADKGVHLQESLELIQKALKLNPDNGAYLDSLGWVYYRLGRYEEALPPLRRAVEMLDKEDKQEDATVLDHLAEVLLKLGKQPEAVEVLRRAVKLEPDNKGIAEKLEKYSASHTGPIISPAAPPESPAH